MTDHSSVGRTDPPTVWPSGSNVVLTGFMGTGKSTIGRVLAERLGYEFVDTDDVIESRHGTIASIFEQHGEAAFRQFENDVAHELASRSRLVIATGGRFMLDDRNVAAFAGRCRVCCLVAPVDEILERVTSDAGRHERPLLRVTDPRQRIEDLLAERDEGYRRFLRISTSRRSPDSIVDEIIAALAPPPLIADPSPSGQLIVGTALLTVVSELIGAVAVVQGNEADRFRSQIALSASGRDLCIGDPLDDSGDVVGGRPPVWAPSDSIASFNTASFNTVSLNTVGGSRTPSDRVIILDAALIQAASPGMVEWSAIFDRMREFVDGRLG